jgi:hypothetical protein
MGVSMLAWAFAPTMPLIMLAHVALAIGNTFLSGAEDALFYRASGLELLVQGVDVAHHLLQNLGRRRISIRLIDVEQVLLLSNFAINYLPGQPSK